MSSRPRVLLSDSAGGLTFQGSPLNIDSENNNFFSASKSRKSSFGEGKVHIFRKSARPHT